MALARWLALALLATCFAVGCGERKPDTDPSDSELQVPNVDSGDSAAEKSDSPK